MNNMIGPKANSEKQRSGLLINAIVVLSLIGGLQAASQYLAHTFNYQPILGVHLGYVYPPWAILQWAAKWYSNYPDQFMEATATGAFVTTFGLLGVAITKVVATNTSKGNKFLHGSARWANKKDIQSAGLLPNPQTVMEIMKGKKKAVGVGVYVGGWEGKNGHLNYLRHNGPEHVLCYAPTRSGKGVGLVIPTLLSWYESAVITDLKGELWALTAGWRKKKAKNRVLRFEPASSNGGICWNPLDEIRLDTEFEVGDVQNLAQIIVDPDGKGLDSHWQKTSFSLMVGLILHALYKAKKSGGYATITSIDEMLSNPDQKIGFLWDEMAKQDHNAIRSSGRDMMDRAGEEADSVLSTVKSFLSLYRDPIVAQSVSKSEFSIKDLMHHDDPVSLYIITQPNDKTRLRPLVRIMINMIVRLLADKMDFENGRPVAHYKHRLLLMLDEFPSLGKIEILQESLAFVASYGIKCYLICQDINQIKSRESGYGPDESITSNCHVQNAYPPNRIETAEHLSRLTGQTTIVTERITTSGSRTSSLLGKVSRTFQEIQRPLLTPDECLRMPAPRKTSTGDIDQAGDMVIYIAGYPAIYGKQLLYFKDPVFKVRAAIKAPESSDTTKSPETDEITAPEVSDSRRVTELLKK